MGVLYHRDKANVFADTLSHLSMVSMYHVDEGKNGLVNYVHRLFRLVVRLEDSPNCGFVVHNNSSSSLVIDAVEDIGT